VEILVEKGFRTRALFLVDPRNPTNDERSGNRNR
jgi:hypothetical protein